ncbi:MAG TPA: glycosyltransferase family 39 protein [Verrucomicrobiae bacterium]|nr:glycosyltransferase family 39 protein [Verrucomicrobiae bacterium]
MSAEIHPANRAAAGEGPAYSFLPPWTWPILASALAWLVIFIAIPAGRQNFPLGDDWAFAHGAIWFAHGRGIHYSDWASMPQLGQWLWSCPFLSLTSLSHVALRVSVIVLSWLGLAAFYDLMRQGGISARLAALAACVLALDPVFFVSQGTYMTDVPALSFGLLALNFYARALAGKNVRWLMAALCLAVLAVITRQTMLAVPVAAGLLLLRDREIRWKPVWLLSMMIPSVVCLYTAWWFSRRPDVLPMQPVFSLSEILFRPFLAIHLCGLVAFPLCLLVPFPKNRNLLTACLLVVLFAAVGVFYFYGGLPYGGLFPYSTGMLSPWGTYSPGLVMGQRDILLTQPWRTLFTVLGCLGAAQILAVLVERIRARKFPGILAIFTFLQFLIILTLPGMTDRYLEVLFPGAIFVIATRGAISRPRWLAAVAVTGLCGLVSVALLHDWLSWNSARWDLGRQAVAAKAVPPADIEGGFEWNGWYTCPEPGSPPVATSLGHTNQNDGLLLLPFTRFFFPDVNGRFALAFTQPPDSTVVASQPYTLWLPPAHKEFLFVQKAP